MFHLHSSLRYFLYPLPVDMRKSFYTLSGISYFLHEPECPGRSSVYLHEPESERDEDPAHGICRADYIS